MLTVQIFGREFPVLEVVEYVGTTAVVRTAFATTVVPVASLTVR